MPKKAYNTQFFTMLIVGIILSISLTLHIHNALLYEPKHGFDGTGHIFYAQYIAQHGTIPAPDLDWETHQPPLYYLIGAYVLHTFNTTKALQLINPVIFFLLIAIVYFSAHHTFKDTYKSLIATFAFMALPMINIFPPMVTNELLNTLWITASVTAALFIATAATKKKLIIGLLLWLFATVVGIYTKITIVTALPAFFVACVIQLVQHKSIVQKKIKILLFTLIFALFLISSLPILSRKQGGESPSNIQRIATSPFKKDLIFFTRLDWILKLDMFNAHYYSFLGGSWNSLWQDGHNAITPFVLFHKKVLILWSLGFILLPLSLYGLGTMWNKHRKEILVLGSYGISALLFYIFYNAISTHYSAVRLTYIMPIALVYAFGIAGAAQGKKLKWILLTLLLIQYSVMVSHFWIQPWWHVTR